MGTSAIVIPRTYRAYKWSTGQVRPFPQPPGLWLPTTNYDPAKFPWYNEFAQTNALIAPRPDAERSAYSYFGLAYYNPSTGNTFQHRWPTIFRGGARPYNYHLDAGPAGMAYGATEWNPAWASPSAAVIAGYGDLLFTPSAALSDEPVRFTAFSQDGTFTSGAMTLNTVAGYYFDAATPANSYGFIFLDPVNGVDPTAYPSTTGVIDTFESPIKTLNWAFGAAQNDQTYPNAIIVIKGSGTVPLFAQGTSNILLSAGKGPISIIAMGGVTAVLDRTNASGGAAISLGNTNDVVYQGFGLNGTPSSPGTNYWDFLLGSLTNRFVAQNISNPEPFSGTDPNDNGTMFFAGDPDSGGTSVRQYIALKGCTEANRPNVGSVFASLYVFYKVQYISIDLCEVHNSAGYPPGLKASCMDATISNCTVIPAASGVYGCFGFSAQNNVALNGNYEFCYCVGILAPGGGYGVEAEQQAAVGDPLTLPGYIYRCSFLNCYVDVFKPGQVSLLHVSNCAIQYNTGENPVTPGSNIFNTGTACQGTSGILNADGTLTTAYQSYLGQIGSQVAS